MKIIAASVAILGVIILVVASVLGFRVLLDYVDNKIEEEVSLVAHSDTWNKWSDIDRPIYLNVYVFNVTNPDQYEAGRHPVLVELGPYAYKQMRRKRNLSQLNGDRMVSYEQEIYYVFDKEASGGNRTEDDLVNVFNVAYYSVISGAGPLGPALAQILSNISSESLIRRKVRVGDLTFEGYDTSIYTVLFGSIGLPTPPDLVGGFGIYKGKNGSTDGVYTIHTGVGDSSQFGKILLWNDDTDLHIWTPFSECDKITGTDGSIFPPFVEKNRIVEIFSTDLCRSLYLTYESEVEVHGVKGYRFTVPPDALEDPRTNPKNRCYCRAENVTDCLSSGVMDVSACRNGAPIVLSTPFFLDGNDDYSMVSGLWPVKERHETSIDIEINTGVLLGAHKRIQVNVNYKKIANVVSMINAIEMVFPVLWVDESVEFTADSAQELKDKLLSPKKAIETWRWVGVGVGIALILGGMGIYLFGRKRSSREASFSAESPPKSDGIPRVTSPQPH